MQLLGFFFFSFFFPFKSVVLNVEGEKICIFKV